MLKQKIFKRAFWTLVVLGVLNFIATILYLHWSLWWFDVILHFLGGLTVALFALWFFSANFDLQNWKLGKIVTMTLISTICIGILWEFYELYFGLTFLSDGWHYFADTGSDLIMDTVGGIVGFLWINKILNQIKI
jgi:hypothetical protein